MGFGQFGQAELGRRLEQGLVDRLLAGQAGVVGGGDQAAVIEQQGAVAVAADIEAGGEGGDVVQAHVMGDDVM
ncbi:MAG: hypothetical protein CVU20_06420 [Betaproteobacteria bacterium HGW-Betaproteobacteria-14]|nr:MAG: hypothetical protein CVU20_06420 [Betaproteobacteria bacterium HGW-Betaproteobacteria-14]